MAEESHHPVPEIDALIKGKLSVVETEILLKKFGSEFFHKNGLGNLLDSDGNLLVNSCNQLKPEAALSQMRNQISQMNEILPRVKYLQHCLVQKIWLPTKTRPVAEAMSNSDLIEVESELVRARKAHSQLQTNLNELIEKYGDLGQLSQKMSLMSLQGANLSQDISDLSEKRKQEVLQLVAQLKHDSMPKAKALWSEYKLDTPYEPTEEEKEKYKTTMEALAKFLQTTMNNLPKFLALTGRLDQARQLVMMALVFRMAYLAYQNGEYAVTLKSLDHLHFNVENFLISTTNKEPTSNSSDGDQTLVQGSSNQKEEN